MSLDLESLRGRFVDAEAEEDLLSTPGRTLVYRGPVFRQATKSVVERYCLLFNDLFVVTELAATSSAGKMKGMFNKIKTKKAAAAAAQTGGGTAMPVDCTPEARFEMKQQVDLMTVRLDSRRSVSQSNLAFAFAVIDPERTYAISGGSAAASRAWLRAITRAVRALMTRDLDPGSGAADAGFAPAFWHTYLHGGTLWWAAAAGEENELALMVKEVSKQQQIQRLCDDDDDEAAGTGDGGDGDGGGDGDDGAASFGGEGGVFGTVVDVRDDLGYTPFLYALELGSAEMVTTLLNAGADATQPVAGGEAPLFFAARHGHAGVVDALIDAGVDVNDEDGDGRSPLWHVVNEQLRRCVDKRTAAVADAAAAGDGVVVAVCADAAKRESAAAAKTKRMVAALADDGAVIDVLYAGSIGDVAAAAASGVVAAATGEFAGLTLLQVAVAQRCEEAVGPLLVAGASVTQCDASGRTPLHVAIAPGDDGGVAASGSTAVAMALLEHGAQPNACDFERRTPMHLCRTVAAAKVLAMYGARPDLQCINGDKPAVYGGNSKSTIDKIAQAFLTKATVASDSELCDKDSVAWMPDNAADECVLCMSSWGLTRRRHHCRRCGLLVCAQCSSRRFDMNLFSGAVAGGSADAIERCCDGCYNLLKHKHMQACEAASVARAFKRSEDKARESRIGDLGDLSSQAGATKGRAFDDARAELLRERKEADGAGSKEDGGGGVGDVSAKTNELASQLKNSKQMLIERQEQLSRMENNSAELNDAASNFADMAKQLRQKQSRGFFG
jgi:ankyrin repeat protein